MTKRLENAGQADFCDGSPLPRDLVPPNPYAVPLTTLVAGAYVGGAEQVQVHPSSTLPDDVSAGFGSGFAAGGGSEGVSD